jgi:uncharacterized protein (DUF111 family)
MVRIIDRSGLDAEVKSVSKRIFGKIASTEAGIHGDSG